ncbi:hypothetical protein FRC04_002090 [Tulasnella sp. 424]|nr:hypothetical protein FRC04_002090 [Tulasnella sp. 424]
MSLSLESGLKYEQAELQLVLSIVWNHPNQRREPLGPGAQDPDHGNHPTIGELKLCATDTRIWKGCKVAIVKEDRVKAYGVEGLYKILNECGAYREEDDGFEMWEMKRRPPVLFQIVEVWRCPVSMYFKDFKILESQNLLGNKDLCPIVSRAIKVQMTDAIAISDQLQEMLNE